MNNPPDFRTLPSKKLVGNKLSMSFAANRTGYLWRSFMPRRREIANPLTTDLFSLQVYPADFFQKFNPTREFEKWAAVEVEDFRNVPNGMETLVLPAGLYAVFLHRGSNRDTGTFTYIFQQWLPSSGYVLDDRPHFELLGEKYRNDDPASEEEFWIPVKK